ncbi:phosphoribosylglycinamide synthetase [Thermoanaerobacter kivui]|uniref:Phosphoribosylglycinamide synthetase n=1 Tax=Thermoanaerobacter kivui TaxID=2325 RepID=A0A097AQQ4_THEKI|nr:ATP-grasp domain-containing protein [Thermoanaerobacter kivui]AIS52133.1 phosphoribosylglycinamide synthetase [Thermoanaerobacter kivui]
MSKHVMVFGGFFPLHERLVEMGASLTILTTTDKIKAHYPKIYKRVVTLEKGAKREDWIAMAKAIDEIEKVDAIGAFQDYLQKEAAWAAEALNLPFDNTADVVRLVENKNLMRDRLRAAGVDKIKNAVINNIEEALAFVSEVSYPVILKPTDSMGSTGIYKIENEKELREKISDFKSKYPHLQMYMEEFIEGEEFSVEAFSKNGTHYVYGITKKYKELERFVEIGHTVPADIRSEKEQEIKSFVEKVLTCLGVMNGPTHTEVMISKDGIHVVETHTRLGGDMIPELYSYSVNNKVDILDLVARHTLGENVMEEFKKHFKGEKEIFASIFYKIPEKLGVVKRISGLSEAKAKEGVQQVELSVKEGDKVTELLNSFTRLGFAIATGRTAEESLQRAKEAINSIEMEIEE